MKLNLLLLLSVMFTSILCLAEKYKPSYVYIDPPKILYIINFHDKPPSITYNNFIDPEARTSIHFLHGQQYEELFKIFGTRIIAVVQLKPNVRVMTLKDIYTKYHILEKYQNAKVFYNEELINFPETIFTSSSQISKVNIVKTSKGVNIYIIGHDFSEIKKLKYQKARGEIFIGQ